MDDTISRRAAIDEIKKCRFVVDAIERIRGLPSAQPDHSGDVNGKVDLIDRQAAIDAIETGKQNHGDFLTSSFVGYEMAEKIVKALPPALPDLDEWCTDCKEYDKERNSCPRWNRVIKETLNDLQEERKMQLSEESTIFDCISRQAAIKALHDEIVRRRIDEDTNDDGTLDEFDTEAILRQLPSAQPEQCEYYALCRHGRDENKLRSGLEVCEYCHEDSEGYVVPIEKNCHAFIRFGMNGWELDMKAKGWHGNAKIRYCPMCGRDLFAKMREGQDEID